MPRFVLKEEIDYEFEEIGDLIESGYILKEPIREKNEEYKNIKIPDIEFQFNLLPFISTINDLTKYYFHSQEEIIIACDYAHKAEKKRFFYKEF